MPTMPRLYGIIQRSLNIPKVQLANIRLMLRRLDP